MQQMGEASAQNGVNGLNMTGAIRPVGANGQRSDEPPPWKETILEPINGIVQPPVIPPPHRPGRKTNQLRSMKKVFRAVFQHEHSWPFRQPVNAIELGVQDYHYIIKRPMDLGTIGKRLKNDYYWSAKECIEDFHTMFSNCYVYNEPGEDIIILAQALEKVFLEKVAKLPRKESVIRASAPRSLESAMPADRKMTVDGGSQRPKKKKKKTSTHLISDAANSTGATGPAGANGQRSAEPPPREEPLLEPINGIVQPPVRPPAHRPGRKTNQLRYISKKVFRAVFRHRYSWPFRQPVNAIELDVPDYYDIIKRPMDLGTIKKRLKNTYYWSAKECIEDFFRMFLNCHIYCKHREDAILRAQAQALEGEFLKKVAKLPTEEFVI